MREVSSCEKNSTDGKPGCCRTRILTNAARKRNRKEVFGNYNKQEFLEGFVLLDL